MSGLTAACCSCLLIQSPVTDFILQTLLTESLWPQVDTTGSSGTDQQSHLLFRYRRKLQPASNPSPRYHCRAPVRAVFTPGSLTAEWEAPFTRPAGSLQQIHSRLRSAPPQAIYQPYKTKAAALIWDFIMVLNGPQKSSWSSLRCKDKGHNHTGPDLMALVNRNDC